MTGIPSARSEGVSSSGVLLSSLVRIATHWRRRVMSRRVFDQKVLLDIYYHGLAL